MGIESIHSAYDVLIIGGGPAGLCLAGSLVKAGLSVAVVEKQPHQVLEAPPDDGREIALTFKSIETLQDLGIWDRIPQDETGRIGEARVLNGRSSYALDFPSDAAGPSEALGYLVSNRLIRAAAFAAVRGNPNFHLFCGAAMDDMKTDTRQGRLFLTDGRVLSARLIVAADSRFSAARDKMGIASDAHHFGHTAIVCRMAHQLGHDNVAHECFHYGRTLAILPLAGNLVSVVITAPADKAAAIMYQDKADFEQDVAAQFGNRLGGMTLVGDRYAYPLVAVYANRFYGMRFALVGDASVGMHPVTAHGFNLGLAGQKTLADLVIAAHQAGQDIGAESVLERYNRLHRRATRPLYLATNALVALYTRSDTASRMARRALLRAGNRIPFIKRRLIHALTDRRTGT